MIYSVGPAAEIGVIADRPSYAIPPHAWTSSQNMQFRDGVAKNSPGYASAYTPSIAPYYAEFVPGASTNLWAYLGLTKAYATDGTTHADITRTVGGDYTATADLNWTGGVLGGIAVFNNGVDAPQAWTTAALATPLVALANWPASTTCRSLRPFKNYLVALNVDESGTRYPRLVRWSHPAVPGAVPSSWDYTNTAVDAGRVELAETSDALVDQCTLRGVNILYKEESTFAMTFIGGNDIFRFEKIFDTVGILSRRCVVAFKPGQHAVFCKDDIVIHDGQTVQSLVDEQIKSKIFGELAPDYYQRSFVFADFANKEVFFCYPRRGQALPDIAFVWNWQNQAKGFRNIPLVTHAARGAVSYNSVSSTWDTDSAAWDTDIEVWDLDPTNTRERRVLLAVPGVPALYGFPTGLSTEASYVERVGLGLPVKMDGPPDFTSRKLVTRIWPHIIGDTGAVVNCYLGGQETVKSGITWSTPESYVVGTTQFVDLVMNARLHSVRFENTTGANWQLSSYDVEYVGAGT